MWGGWQQGWWGAGIRLTFKCWNCHLWLAPLPIKIVSVEVKGGAWLSRYLYLQYNSYIHLWMHCQFSSTWLPNTSDDHLKTYKVRPTRLNTQQAIHNISPLTWFVCTDSVYLNRYTVAVYIYRCIQQCKLNTDICVFSSTINLTSVLLTTSKEIYTVYYNDLLHNIPLSKIKINGSKLLQRSRGDLID